MSYLIIANWKMNPQTLVEAKRLFNSIKRGIKNIKNACPVGSRRLSFGVEVVICPPFVYLPVLGASVSIKGYDGLRFGSQDCFWENSGAFTGEVSPIMLKDLGCQYVILGHSERRKYLKETDEMINKKIKAALRAGLTPILCVGSKKRGEKAGQGMKVQLKRALKGIKKTEVKKIVFTYEPVWAISSTKGAVVATPENTKEGAVFIRKILTELFDKSIVQKIRIIYGGSVDSANIEGFIRAVKMDGVLIGAASLRPNDFISAVKKVDLISKNC